jgi:hypothetical protein
MELVDETFSKNAYVVWEDNTIFIIYNIISL